MSLLNISRLIANSALKLGGSYIQYYKATFCPGTRDDGSPCFNERTGAPWVECPICEGRGHTYAKPIIFKGVYTDNSNKISYNPEGVLVTGDKTLSIPHYIDAGILKDRVNSTGTGTSRVLRDKFVILSPNGQPVEILYMLHESVDPTINSGDIYKIIAVGNNANA